VRSPAFWLLAWLAVAGLRLGYGLSHDMVMLEPDDMFHRIAENIAAGRGFSYDGVTPGAQTGPFYPAALAVFYKAFGPNPRAAMALNFLFGLGAALLTWRTARVFLPGPAAQLVGLATLGYPAYWTFDIRLRLENAIAFLAALAVWAAVRAQTAPGATPWPAAGAAAGLNALGKAVVAPFTPLMGLFLWKTRGWKTALLFCAASALVVLPWTLRNAARFHRFMPVSTGFGSSLWWATEDASAGIAPPPVDVHMPVPTPPGANAYEAGFRVDIDAAVLALAKERLRADPWGYGWGTARRAVAFWTGNVIFLVAGKNGFRAGFAEDRERRGLPVAAYSFAKRLFLVPGLVALAGVGLLRRRREWRTLFPVMAMPLTYNASYALLTVDSGRYNLPVLPQVFLLAACAFFTLSSDARRDRSV